MATKVLAPGTAQSIEPDSTTMLIKDVLVSADVGAPAVLTIKGNGVANVVIQVPAGTSFQWGSRNADKEQIRGPVTADLVGALSFARISW